MKGAVVFSLLQMSSFIFSKSVQIFHLKWLTWIHITGTSYYCAPEMIFNPADQSQTTVANYVSLYSLSSLLACLLRVRLLLYCICLAKMFF